MPLYTPYMEGARRSGEEFFMGPGLPTAMGAGTAALTEDQVLRDLLAQFQSFINSSVTDILPPVETIDSSMLAGGGGIGGEITGPTDNGVGPRIDPAVLSTAGTILGPLAQITNSEPLALIANMTGLAGNLANADPTSAMLGMTQNFANLAGANPIVTSTIGALINAARDPVDYTAQDIAGKIIDIALSPTPFNLLSNVLTGKTIGQQFKAANTPVEEAVPGGNVSDLLAEQANALAKETNSDPLDALMSITNAFGTGPKSEAPASPGVQLADLAASMLGAKPDQEVAAVVGDVAAINENIANAPINAILNAQDVFNAEPPAAPVETAAPVEISAPVQTAPAEIAAPAYDLTQFGPSLSDILAMQEAFNASVAADAEAAAPSESAIGLTPGLDLTAIDPGIAAFGMDIAGDSGNGGGLWGGDGGDGLL